MPDFNADREVEERLQRALVAAPSASRLVAASIRDAYVLYYQATGRPPVRDIGELLNEARRTAYDAALAKLHACVEKLTAAIDPALRDR